jgi:Zn-dependent metalloprotease
MIFPAAGLDAIGHELTHGITENGRTDLPGSTGRAQEAFSDIMGEMVEASRDGEPDWQIGEEIPSLFEILRSRVIRNDTVGAFRRR